MDITNLNFLTKLSNIVQVLAIVLIFLGGALQASRFYIDRKINNLKEELTEIEKNKSQGIISNLESTIKSQSAKIEDQKIKLHEVEGNAKPRSIPDKDVSKLTFELSKYKGDNIQITCVMGDQEAYHFASELKHLFDHAGWIVNGVNQGVYNNPIKGIILVMKNEGIKPKADYIFHVLSEIGYRSVGEINKSANTDLEILVGAK